MATLFSKSYTNKRRIKRKNSQQQLTLLQSTIDEKNDNGNNNNNTIGGGIMMKGVSSTTTTNSTSMISPWSTFQDLGLAEPLVETCSALGFKHPSPVQRTIIPYLLNSANSKSHILALAETGSGKTAAFVLPILHHLANDPYGIYAVIISPTRELAKQIHQQVLALGTKYNIEAALVVGGLDMVRQACSLDKKPHFVVATPGRLAELLRGPNPPYLKHVRYLVLDEADRLLSGNENSGFQRDVAELLLHCNNNNNNSNNNRTTKRRTICQTMLFSATLTKSLETIEEIAGGGKGRLPLKKFVIKSDTPTRDSDDNRKTKKQRVAEDDDDDDSDDDDQHKPQSGGESSSEEDSDDDAKQQSNSKEEQSSGEGSTEEVNLTPRIPAGLKQEYIFMPSRVRDAYLLTTIRTLMSNGGRAKGVDGKAGWSGRSRRQEYDSDDDDDTESNKARSTIVFVSTCERAALVSEILLQVGVANVALHSLLSQNRRLAALGKFKSQQVRVLVATDVASRGLDIPSVDLIVNSELPRNPVAYVHRVGRTARAGRRGRAISLVGENDVNLVHAAENLTGRSLEKCSEVTDDDAIKMLGPVTKAARLAKMKLMDIGFDELVKKFKERKVRDRQERKRIEKALKKQQKQMS